MVWRITASSHGLQLYGLFIFMPITHGGRVELLGGEIKKQACTQAEEWT
jgi:hypothetical protein